jgi:hypothetical protein
LSLVSGELDRCHLFIFIDPAHLTKCQQGLIMIPYDLHRMAQDRQAEFLRDAKNNRWLNQQIHEYEMRLFQWLFRKKNKEKLQSSTLSVDHNHVAVDIGTDKAKPSILTPKN